MVFLQSTKKISAVSFVFKETFLEKSSLDLQPFKDSNMRWMILSAFLMATPALAQTPSVEFQNKTGHVVVELYVSPTASDDWGRDRLGRDTLANNARRRLRLQGACAHQDIQAVLEQGPMEWRDVNVCAGRFVLDPNKTTTSAVQAAQDLQPLKIENKLGADVQILAMFWRTQEGAWGPDRFGENLLEPHQSIEIQGPKACESVDVRFILSHTAADKATGEIVRLGVPACDVLTVRSDLPWRMETKL